MASSNVDTIEIVDIVQQSLESDGILQSIRAQIRAYVYNLIIKNNHQAAEKSKANELGNSALGNICSFNIFMPLNLDHRIISAQHYTRFPSDARVEANFECFHCRVL